jgi:hypothetical protein
MSVRSVLLLTTFLTFGLLPMAGARAQVTVRFIAPETYADASLYGGNGELGREPALRAIERDLQQFGRHHLVPGESLTIEILDIDLAGRFEPWRPFASDLRFMREITWPRIKLRYHLSRPASAPISGEETITDMTYLWRAGLRSTGEIMPYEKAMLADWLRVRLGSRRVPSS